MANKPKQTVPADFYVGFTGAGPQMNVGEPKLGQVVEYTVAGTVTRVAETIRDDGETRLGVSVSVESCWPAGTTRPAAANQALMFDHEGNPTDEAADSDG
jgi:hypothetical protein